MVDIDTSDITESELPQIDNGEAEIKADAESIEISKLREEINQIKANIAETKSNTELKKKLAWKTFRFMEGFVCLIFVFLLYYFCYFAYNNEEVPKEVIIALITTSLAAVVGLVGFILKGLFGSKE